MSTHDKTLLTIAGLSLLVATIGGAVASHVLTGLDAAALHSFETAVDFQFFHALGLIGVVLLGQKTPCTIHGGAGNMRVDVNAAWHHHHAGGVDGSRPSGNVGHYAAVRYADVANVAVHSVGRVVDRAADDPQALPAHRPAPVGWWIARSSSSSESAAGRGCNRTGVSGSGTSSMR